MATKNKPAAPATTVKESGNGNGNGGAALATRGAPLAAAPLDELAEVGLDTSFDIDGLEEAGAEDMRVPAAVFNFKGVDAATGRSIPPDVFFNTVDETTKGEIDAAFLLLHKTNLFSVFNKAANKNDIICRSFDRVNGTMNTGLQRPCEGCPDAVWRTEDGKRTRNCGPVYNMFAVDRETQMPFVVRFRRTSLPVIKSYLQKHHIGRRIAAGKRTNYPLFCFQVGLSLKMSPDGKYALPVLTRGEVLSRDEMIAHSGSAQYLYDNMFKVLTATEDGAVAREGGESDATSADYTAGTGQDFVTGDSDRQPAVAPQ